MIWNIISLTKTVDDSDDSVRRLTANKIINRAKKISSSNNYNKTLLFDTVNSLDDKLVNIAQKKVNSATVDCGQCNKENLKNAKIIIPISSILS